MNELSFRRYSYTVVFKRNLQNRWRPHPRKEEADLIVPLIDGQPVATLVVGTESFPDSAPTLLSRGRSSGAARRAMATTDVPRSSTATAVSSGAAAYRRR